MGKHTLPTGVVTGLCTLRVSMISTYLLKAELYTWARTTAPGSMTTPMTNRSGGPIDTTIWLDQCHMTLISMKSTVPAEAVSILWTMTTKAATGMPKPLVKNHNALASRSWKPINSSSPLPHILATMVSVKTLLNQLRSRMETMVNTALALSTPSTPMSPSTSASDSGLTTDGA